MKKSTFVLTLLSAGLLSATPASAAEHYISGSIGIPDYLNLNSSYSYYNSATDNLVRDTKISLDSGILLFGAVGVDYGNVRVEGELGYQTFNFNNVKVHATGTGQTATNYVSQYVADMSGGAFNETSTYGLSGKGNVTSLMANAYYDLPVGGGIKPYVTAGVGVAQVRYVQFGINGLPNPVYSNPLNQQDNDSTTFAYQFGAGIAVPVSKKVTLDARYRYFTTAHYNMAGFSSDASLQNQQFLVSVRVGI